MSHIYRLIYTSRNLLAGDEEEQAAAVAGILAVSKRNNARVGVTGALLFNAGFFAQVLEGPRDGVEATFERIQRDSRHSDVSVLQCEPTLERGFPNWSMAFVGQSQRGRALWGEFAARTGFDLRNMEADRLFATLLALVEREEGDETVAAEPALARGLDVEELRGVLRDRLSEPPAPPPIISSTHGIEAGVLRTALDDERARTTALRRELDDARVALGLARTEAELAARSQEIWAERARAMAAILAREPNMLGLEDSERTFGSPVPASRPVLVKTAG